MSENLLDLGICKAAFVAFVAMFTPKVPPPHHLHHDIHDAGMIKYVVGSVFTLRQLVEQDGTDILGEYACGTGREMSRELTLNCDQNVIQFIQFIGLLKFKVPFDEVHAELHGLHIALRGDDIAEVMSVS
jgi:hypothetical protein